MYLRFIENKPEIYRIKSDSFLYAKRIDKSLISDELGMFKKEARYENVVYPHVNYSFKVEGNRTDKVTFWDKDEEAYI